MAAPVTAAMPQDLDLPGGYTVRFTALNPTTGAVVAGVVISGGTILTDTAPANSQLEPVDTSLEQPEPTWLEVVGAVPSG